MQPSERSTAASGRQTSELPASDLRAPTSTENMAPMEQRIQHACIPMLLDTLAVDLPTHFRSLRAPQAFADADFAALKASIAHLGGNVQPVKVRPAEGRYELVFGFRRLKACADLGLPVTAVVQDMPGTQQLLELDASNDDRQVSLYERGCLYDAALQAGYVPSRRRLAESLGRGLRAVSDSILIASLPRLALDALRDPRALTVTHAKRIAAAFEADPDRCKHQVAALGPGSAKPQDLVTTLRVVP